MKRNGWLGEQRRKFNALVRRSIWLNVGKYILITYDPFYHRKRWTTLIGIEKFSDDKTTDIWFRCYKVAFAICLPNDSMRVDT